MRLPPPEQGWFERGYAVLTDGSLARLEASSDINTAVRERPNRALAGLPLGLWPPYEPEARQRIVVLKGSWADTGPTFDVQEIWPQFDRLQNGDWIIADTRCDVVETNARIIARDGKTAGKLLLGDGIGYLQVDKNNHIWVGYFDEGIFGNNAIGASGLNCFDAQGTLLWSNPGNRYAESDFPSIADCYALNVCENAVWASPYTDFPILKIGLDGSFGGIWTNKKTGAGLIAVDGDLVLLLGGYPAYGQGPDERCLGLLLKLDGRAADPIGEFELEIGVAELRELPLAKNRGSALYFIKDDGCYELHVRDVAKELM